MTNKVELKEPESKFKKFLIDFIDIIAFLVFIGGLFLFMKVFVIAVVAVNGESMLPNYKNGDIIFVDKFYWKWKNDLKRGDVLVLMPPTSNVSYLKRLIGLPGETIEIKNKKVYLCKDKNSWRTYTGNDTLSINMFNDGKLICKELKEPYIRGKYVNIQGFPEKIVTDTPCNIKKFVLGSGQYLVFGDDRMHSTDSRCCFDGVCLGKEKKYYITKDEILGRVWNSYLKDNK